MIKLVLSFVNIKVLIVKWQINNNNQLVKTMFNILICKNQYA